MSLEQNLLGTEGNLPRVKYDVKCHICKINSGSQQKASGTPWNTLCTEAYSSFFDIHIPWFLV